MTTLPIHITFPSMHCHLPYSTFHNYVESCLFRKATFATFISSAWIEVANVLTLRVWVLAYFAPPPSTSPWPTTLFLLLRMLRLPPSSLCNLSPIFLLLQKQASGQNLSWKLEKKSQQRKWVLSVSNRIILCSYRPSFWNATLGIMFHHQKPSISSIIILGEGKFKCSVALMFMYFWLISGTIVVNPKL